MKVSQVFLRNMLVRQMYLEPMTTECCRLYSGPHSEVDFTETVLRNDEEVEESRLGPT